MTAACTLPPGEHRECLLRALNSAVNAAQARARQHRELEVLHQELKAKSPAVAELHELASFVSSQFTTLRTKFSKGVDADKARGLDVWKTALPWYEHELCVSESVVKYRLNVMRGVAAKLAEEDQQAGTDTSAPAA